jgi:hypothetical protein
MKIFTCLVGVVNVYSRRRGQTLHGIAAGDEEKRAECIDEDVNTSIDLLYIAAATIVYDGRLVCWVGGCHSGSPDSCNQIDDKDCDRQPSE